MKTHRCVECSLMRCSQESETCEECISNRSFVNIFKGYELRTSKEFKEAFKEGRTWNVYSDYDYTSNSDKGNS